MPEHLSVSQIASYLKCPLHYAFHYIHQLAPEFQSSALAFGKAVHSALAGYHESVQAGMPAEEGEVQALFRADFEAEASLGLRYGAYESTESLLQCGQTLVAEYLRDPIRDAVTSEESFEVLLKDPQSGELLADKTLVGIFDLRTTDGIVEFKTAKTPIDEATLKRHLQLSAYAYAYNLAHGIMPKVTVVHLLKLKKQPRVEKQEVQRTARDVKFFLNCAAQVARAIDAELFPPNPGWGCMNCDYAKACLEI